MKVVVVGGVAWNTMVYIERFPDPVPQTMFPLGMHDTVGSSGAGKALNLRTLGVDVSLWALLGDDEPARRARRTFADADVDFVAEIDPLGTARHVNLMDSWGDRISMIANPGSVDATVDTQPIHAMLEDADLATVTIMNHCRAFLSIVHHAAVPMWVDIHDYDGVDPHHAEFIESADHLIMSSVAMKEWRRFGERAVASGIRTVVCTHGAGGASGITAIDGWVDVPAIPVDQVVDTNGAGDAFFAGFVVERHRGATLLEALGAGAEQGARAVTSPDLAPAV